MAKPVLITPPTPKGISKIPNIPLGRVRGSLGQFTTSTGKIRQVWGSGKILKEVEGTYIAWDDEITPSLKIAAFTLNQGVRMSTKAAADMFSRAVKLSYKTGPARWAPNTGQYKKIKLANVGHVVPMHYTGALQTAVALARPTVIQSGNTFIIDFVPMMETYKELAPYALFNEGRDSINIPTPWKNKKIGSMTIPQREHLITAMEIFREEYTRAMAVVWAATQTVLEKPKNLKLRGAKYSSIATMSASISEREVEGTLKTLRLFHQLFWWFVPPTIMWAFMGAMADITGMITGSFMDPQMFRLWVQGYARGQIGITEKVQRRKFRRALYTGQAKKKAVSRRKVRGAR